MAAPFGEPDLVVRASADRWAPQLSMVENPPRNSMTGSPEPSTS
jgi:hypothetical protein